MDLTEEEVTKTLSTMKNNLAPGTDGITTSFLKFFFLEQSKKKLSYSLLKPADVLGLM